MGWARNGWWPARQGIEGVGRANKVGSSASRCSKAEK
jgi:hypothetical protein